MKWLISLENELLLQSVNSDKFDFVIECRDFSRFGKLSFAESKVLATAAKQKGFRVFLQFDILMTQNVFETKKNLLTEEYLALFDAIRIQDPGAIFWAKEKTSLPLHLILETGNHNLKGIQSWISFVGDRAHRIVLSHELPKSKLQEYKETLNVPVEVLGAGRILLFYTPRNLLSAQFVDHDDADTKRVFGMDSIEIEGSSEESPHKGFPIVENQHGTFMFLPKDFYILDHMNELLGMNIDYLRLDILHLENYGAFAQKFNDYENCDFLAEKQNYPLKTIKGFFNTNKSDVLFSKLKNKKTLRNDENFLGEILEVQKKKYIALEVLSQNGIKVGDTITLYSPDNKIRVHTVERLKNSFGQSCDEVSKGKIAFLPHVGGISVKTMAYFGEDPLAAE